MRRRRAATLAAALLSVAATAHAQLPARWPRAPLTEVARARVRADAARGDYGVTGAGSTLCLVDTGVDDTAVAGLRAAFAPSAPGRGHPLEDAVGGAVYGPDGVGATPPDAHGHGTAMASIATGPDGVAPDAAVLSAGAWDADAGGFQDEAVVRAITWCRAWAARDPAVDPTRLVILLALGGHDGAHDGDGDFERAIVDAAGPVPVVVAAGNDGDRAVHAAGRIWDGQSARVEVRVPRPTIDDAAVALTVAVSPPGRARLVAPNGERSAPLDGATEGALGGAAFEVEARVDALAVTIRADTTTLPSGEWAIEVDGSARFDVWLAGTRLGTPFFAASLGGDFVVEDEAIAIPATAPRLIAVGATVARDAVGELRSIGAPGEVADFSSRGPTAGGVPKPDLVAPGGWILATRSSDLRRGDSTNLVAGRDDYTIDGRVAVRGSSAAAAVVAGALLLALELDPSGGPEARARVVSSLDATGWSPARGYGELDVPRLLARWSGGPPAGPDLAVGRPVLAVDDGSLWLTARGEGDALWVRAGGAQSTVSLRGGAALVRLVLGPRPAGEPLRVEAAIDGAPLPPLDVAVAPDRRNHHLLRGGGCAAAPSRSAPLGLLGLAWIVWRTRGRRRPSSGLSSARRSAASQSASDESRVARAHG